MTSSFRARQRYLIGCATLVALGACSVEERSLTFGVGSTNNLSQAGRTSQGSGNASGEGGDEASAGVQGLGGSASPMGGSAGNETDAGATGSDGGSPDSGGSSTSGGSQAGAGASSGGSANSAGASGASSGSANGGTNGSAGSSGSEGSGGTAVTTDVAPCGDADKNGVQDCLETVVKNATFHVDAKEWKADPSVVAAWKSDDAFGQANSGSLSVTFTTGDGSASWSVSSTSQCLPAWQDTQFELAARVLLANGQGTGNAQISLAMFGNDDCAGSFIGSTAPALTALAGSWQTLRTSAKLSAGTRSVMVRLALAKPGTQPSLEARFDDILLREK